MSKKPRRKSRRGTLRETSRQRYDVRNEKRLQERLAVEFELARQIRQHVGKWVAIADDRIVAVGDDVQDVMEASRKLGYEMPLVVRGPLTPEDVAYVL